MAKSPEEILQLETELTSSRNLLRSVLLGTLLFLGAGSCLAQDLARMDQIVQSFVAEHRFMGTVLVARDSQILFSKGYGSANLEWDVPNSPNTIFRVASLTKQFTAASILLLEERGKLNVHDPMSKYLRDAPPAWERITIFHLLTMTSGIPDYSEFPDSEKLAPLATTPIELLARFRDKPLEFEPGEKQHYSNSNYVLLSHLIEKITGDSYEKFVRENIFMPLGMKYSGYDSNSAIIPHRASGYTPGKNGLENASFIHASNYQGAGGLYSTTEDLLRWEQGLFGGKVLRVASLEKMTTPFKNNYAFGLVVATASGYKVIQHSGALKGFSTELEYYPKDKLTVVVLGNIEGAESGKIAKILAAVAHGEPVKLPSERKEIPLDPKVLSRYVGAYQLNTGDKILITQEGSQLISQFGLWVTFSSSVIRININQTLAPIFPESETRFFLKAVDAQIEFYMDDAQGKASQLIFHQDGRDTTAKRLDDAELQRISDVAAAAAKRFKDQRAAAGSEAALRKLIEDTRLGKPDYDTMSPSLAAAIRQRLPQLQTMVTQRGTIQSITFHGVGAAGPDIYQVKFENGLLELQIWLAPDGRVRGAIFRQLR